MDKSKLLADRVIDQVGYVRIPGVGQIKVRAMSRYEMLEAQRLGGDNPLSQERYILSHAVLDPIMTRDDVEVWQKASPPEEINLVASKINELSGIGQGAGKSKVSAVRGEPGPGVRSLPGGEAGDAGGGPAPADEL